MRAQRRQRASGKAGNACAASPARPGIPHAREAFQRWFWRFCRASPCALERARVSARPPHAKQAVRVWRRPTACALTRRGRGCAARAQHTLHVRGAPGGAELSKNAHTPAGFGLGSAPRTQLSPRRTCGRREYGRGRPRYTYSDRAAGQPGAHARTSAARRYHKSCTHVSYAPSFCLCYAQSAMPKP